MEKALFTSSDMINFATHVYDMIADAPGHEPTEHTLNDWVNLRTLSHFNIETVYNKGHRCIYNEMAFVFSPSIKQSQQTMGVSPDDRSIGWKPL